MASSRRTRIPDLDRIATQGHDLGSVSGKRHQLQRVAVDIFLVVQQVQVVCQRGWGGGLGLLVGVGVDG
jgi:hypothetical protein